MDGKRFDAAARGLAAGASRRAVLGFVLGGVFAAGAASSATAQNRRRRRRRGDGEAAPAEETLAPGTLAGGIWEETIEVCRFDAEGRLRDRRHQPDGGSRPPQCRGHPLS